MFLPNLIHSLSLILTSTLAFIWSVNPEMSKFSLQLSGLLIIIFFFHNLIIKKRPKEDPIISYLNISNTCIVTFLILILILSTGGLTSPLFFTLDFLLFGLSLFFFPSASFYLSLALIPLFLLSFPLQDNYQLANLVSLLLMAPLARFFGTQYLRLLEANNQVKILKHQSKRLLKQVKNEETATLLWLSLDFYNKMYHALDLISQISSSLTSVPYHQKDKLDKLYQDLKELFKSGQELEEQIDQLTDDDDDE